MSAQIYTQGKGRKPDNFFSILCPFYVPILRGQKIFETRRSVYILLCLFVTSCRPNLFDLVELSLNFKSH